MIVLQAPFLETFLLLLLYQKDLFRRVVDKIYISYNSSLFAFVFVIRGSMKDTKKNFSCCFIRNLFSYCFVDVVILLLCESTEADIAVELAVIYCLRS